MELVKGGKEIERALKAIPKQLARRAVNKAAGKAAAVIVRQAKADAPAGDTGALKRNIKREAWRSRYYAKVFAIGVAHGKVPENVGDGFGVSKGRSGKLSVTKLNAREKRGDDPFYFRWQELGWTHAKTGQKIPGKKYLTNAVEKKSSEAIKVYGDVMQAEIARLGKSA